MTLLLLCMSASLAATWGEVPVLAGDPSTMLSLAASTPPTPDAATDLLFIEVRAHVRADGSEEREDRSVERLNTADAVRGFTSIVRTWNDQRQERPDKQVRVVNPDGHVYTLASTAWAPVAGDAADPHVHTERAPAPGLVVGSIVEIDERVVSHPLLPGVRSGRLITSTEYQGRAPARLLVEAPVGVPLRAALRGTDQALAESTVDGIHRFEVTIPGTPDPKDAPAEEDGVPSGQATHPTLDYTTGTSWQAVARGLSNQLDAAMVDPELLALAEATGAGLTGDERLWAGLAAIGTADDAGTTLDTFPSFFGRLPEARRAPAINWADRGVYAVALLRAMGIPADLALIRWGGADLDGTLPGADLFDGVLLRVGGRFLPLFSDLQQPAEFPIAFAGRHVLLVRPDSQGLVPVPMPRPTSHDRVEEAWITRDGVRVTQEGHDRGVFAERMSRSMAVNGLQTTMRLQSGSYPSVQRREDMAVVTTLDDARWSFREPDAAYGTWDGGVYSLRLHPFALSTMLPSLVTDDGATRTREADIGAYTASYTLTAHLPEGYGAIDPPAPIDLTLGDLTLHSSVRVDGATVYVQHTLDTGDGRLTADEVVKLAKAVDDLTKHTALRLAPPAWRDIDAGRVREGIAALRAAAQAAPDDITAQLDLAAALRGAHLGEAARDTLQAALTRHPDDHPLQVALGHALLRDRYGGDGPALDRIAGRDALALGLAGDGADADDLATLARAEEYGSSGIRFGGDAPLDRAAADWARAVAAPEGKGYAEDLADVLAVTRRWDALLALSEEQEEPAWGDAATLVQSGPDALRARLAASGRTVDPKVVTLALLGRAYEPVRNLLQRPLSPFFGGDPDHPWELLRVEDKGLSRKDPASVLALYVEAGLAGRADEARALLTPTLAAEKDPLGLTNADAVINPLSVADIFASMPPEVSGSKKLGWRVAWSVSQPKPHRLAVNYLVSSPTGPLIRSVDERSCQLGLEVLSRAQSHDTKGAAQWLAWAREDMPAEFKDSAWGELPAATPLDVQGAVLAARCGIAEALPVLEASTDAGSERLRLAALSRAYSGLSRWSDLERVSGRLHALTPEARAWQWHANALWRQGKVAETDAWAHSAPNAAAVCTTRIDAAGIAGDLAALDRAAEECLRQDGDPAAILNERVWWAMFQPGDEARELADAKEAARLGGYRKEATNHTLALLLSTSDDPDGALELLDGVIDASALDGSWELVRGKIAADLGYPEVAREIWALVPADPSPYSVGALAAAWRGAP